MPTMNRKYTYRAMTMPPGAPQTIEAESRSVEVVAATETPTEIFDWQRFEVVPEVLLMDGVQLHDFRQIPLLDTHYRGNSNSVIGSFRGMRVEGDKLVGRAHFADAPEGEGPFRKIRDGHLTDFSIGYRVLKAEWVEEGETKTINGRSFDGPVKVATSWVPKELSVCPIGADEFAKARAEYVEAQNQKKARTESPAPDNKEDSMDKRMRAFLERRGLAENATEDEAYEFLAQLEAKDAEEAKRSADATDDRVDVAEAIRAERERVAEIRAMCKTFAFDDMADELINAGTSVSDARKQVIDAVAAREAEAKAPGFRASIAHDEHDKFRSAASDAMLLRSGSTVEKTAPGAEELAGYSLRELARHSLYLAGESTSGQPLEMVGRAMNTGDFQYILANTANKSLAAGFDTAEETWREWCGIGSASDFKTNTIVAASEASDLDQINDEQPYKYGDRTEAQEQFTLATYGKLFAITRHTIINDDLSALTDIPRIHGEAAARKIGDVAYAVLTANAAMGDGTNLFDSAHANIGTSGALSETTVAEAIKLMKVQKDLKGLRRLNIPARYFIAPAALEGSAEIFFMSNNFTGSNAASTRANPYAGSRFTRVYDARLDDDSTTAYYFAGPKGKTVTVYFLNGQQKPYMETKQGWSVDGVEYKVRIDTAAKAVSWKALVKNVGA